MSRAVPAWANVTDPLPTVVDTMVLHLMLDPRNLTPEEQGLFNAAMNYYHSDTFKARSPEPDRYDED